MPSMKSFVDSSKMVHPDQWVMSLVAKPQGKNPEHAIIIVEGIVDDKFFYRRYDLVVKNVPDYKFQQGEGLILIKDDKKTFADYSDDERERYFWAMIMKDKNFEEGCQGASWIITVEEGDKLHKKILEEQKNPPAYQLAGDRSAIASSSSQTGHNCFTWAREKIKEIETNQNIRNDRRLMPTLNDFLGSRTTNYLRPPVENNDATSPTCLLL